MASGYVVSGRGDLDTLFKARTSAKRADVNIKVLGIDISNRYETRATAPIAATGYATVGTDLAQLFENSGASVPIININNVTVASSIAGGTAIARYQLSAAGDIVGTVSGNNTTSDIGDWITPKASMANYDARVDLVSGGGTVGGSAITTWLNLGTSREWTVTQTGPGMTSSFVDISIRLASDGTVLDTARINFQATRSS